MNMLQFINQIDKWLNENKNTATKSFIHSNNFNIGSKNNNAFWFNSDIVVARKELPKIRYGEIEINGFLYFENQFGENCKVRSNIYMEIDKINRMSLSELNKLLFC